MNRVVERPIWVVDGARVIGQVEDVPVAPAGMWWARHAAIGVSSSARLAMGKDSKNLYRTK